MSSRRVWLTVALVFLALIVSISGIALFWNANANHAQSTSVGKTSLAATSASTQTPANTTIPASAQSPTATATHKAKPTPRPTPSPTRAHPTATPTTGATPSPTATTVMASCQVNYQISSQWSNGFVANVMIKNTGKSSIQNWTLSFTFPGPEHIYSSWGGHVTQKHSQVTITSDGSNTTIAPGATVTPGFQALSGDNNSGDTPSSFTLNGMTCQ